MRAALLNGLTGHGIALPIAALLLVGIGVYASASRLARHADAIADATGLAGLWVGTLILAASTSLPELVTDVYAAALGAPDIGIGDLLGSSLANMLILALLDLVYFRRRLLDSVSRDHVMVGALGVILTALAGAAMASGGWGRIGRIGVETLVIAGVYLLGMRAVHGERPEPTPPEQLPLGATSGTVLRGAVMGFALGAAALAVLAPLLVISAEALARVGGLSDTFVGTLLVGLTTSLPEAAATVAAVRLGALDLAVGNLFGSNAFNLCVLLPMDLASGTGPVLVHAASQDLIAAQLTVTAIALGLVRILARRGRRLGPWRIESVLIVLTYSAAAWLLGSR